MMNSSQKNTIEFQGIHKRFGGIHAVKDVSFGVRYGEVHGLVGENGAGKSTLVKIIGGIHQPDDGRIIFNGERVSFRDPKQSEGVGIRIVHQEVPICLNLTVAENIFLDPFPPSKGIFIDRASMTRTAQQILDRLGIDLNPKQLVGHCSPAQRQLVLVAKALAEKVKLVVMDEPTSSLAEAEVELLFTVIKKLQQEGETFMFISHRLSEVIDICDSVTVMRNGEYIDTLDNAQRSLPIDLLTEKIVGKEVADVTPSEGRRVQAENVVLELRNVSQEQSGLNEVCFQLYQGEILGIAGLLGAGRTELLRCIFGMEPPTGGEMFLFGKSVSLGKPIHAIQKGIGFVSEDRSESLYYGQSIWANITSVIVDRVQKFGFMKKDDCVRIANRYKEELQMSAPSVHTEVFSLSGGNQQKVIFGRWLASSPSILLLDEPTRGVDVGAKAEIRRKILDLADNGMSVIYVSLDFDELVKVSDRILVMSRRRIERELRGGEMTVASIVKNINIRYTGMKQETSFQA
ncbi:MAG: sugar ABC transporter ATP-binding protein [bacterium]|nr:sugar ABC transporter ATP-binding protein [bacterium]